MRRSSAASSASTSWTRPICSARAASKRSPVAKSARAWLSPIFATTNGLITAGRMPSLTSVKPKTASCVARTMSLTAQRPIPPPSAAPCTRVITGTGHSSIAPNIAAMRPASASFSSTLSSCAARIQVTSAPALNDAPSPARTTPRSSSGGSSASSSKRARSSAISSALNALRTSGRDRVTCATNPSRVTRSGPITARSLAPAAEEWLRHGPDAGGQRLLEPDNVDRRKV